MIGFEKWNAGHDSARQAWAAACSPPAGIMLLSLEKKARRGAARLGATRLNPGERAAIKRWAIEALSFCTLTMHEPAPPGLLDLVKKLLGEHRQRSGIKNEAAFRAAVEIKAGRTTATPSQIRDGLKSKGYKIGLATVKAWVTLPEFEAALTRQKRISEQYRGM